METKVHGANSFIQEICAIPGGEQIRLCIQCGTCSASCPTVSRWEHPLRKVIAMARAGLRDEVLSSNSMWFCASCYLCTVRCPRDIKPTDLMHALECIAVRHGLATKRSNTPIMYKAFAEAIKNDGRIHELGFTIRFYQKILMAHLRTNPLSTFKMVSLVKMVPTAMGLFSHGRMGLKGSKIKGTKELQAILGKAEELGGKP